MNKILFILTVTIQIKVFAQCDSLPIVYNAIKKESICAQQENLNYYEPKIEFIGYPKDSIYVGINSSVEEQLFNHLITTEFETKNKLYGLVNPKLSIRVCNSNIIKMSYNYGDSKHFKQVIVNSFSVIIKNIDSIPIKISCRRLLPLVIEMEEIDGNWKPIFDNSKYLCCGKDPIYYIKSNEIVILTVPIIPTKKRFRLKIWKTYSNIFYPLNNLD